MARYTGPKAKLCRREGTALFGIRKHGDKVPWEKRPYPPGQHGQRRIRMSDYGIQLREKQKVKRMYGLLEKQFRRYFTLAQKSQGVTGQKLLEFLERRLDNVVYRLGFAMTRPEGRQMVAHRGVTVNDKRVDIPSYLVQVGDTIQVRTTGTKGQSTRVKDNLERTKEWPVPSWLQVDVDQLKGVVVRAPQRDDVDADVREQLIIELYSK